MWSPQSVFTLCVCHIVLLLGSLRPVFFIHAPLWVMECCWQNSVLLNLPLVLKETLKYKFLWLQQSTWRFFPFPQCPLHCNHLPLSRAIYLCSCWYWPLLSTRLDDVLVFSLRVSQKGRFSHSWFICDQNDLILTVKKSFWLPNCCDVSLKVLICTSKDMSFSPPRMLFILSYNRLPFVCSLHSFLVYYSLFFASDKWGLHCSWSLLLQFFFLCVLMHCSSSKVPTPKCISTSLSFSEPSSTYFLHSRALSKNYFSWFPTGTPIASFWGQGQLAGLYWVIMLPRGDIGVPRRALAILQGW